jgi:ABC-type branched-subunit amino acid transport system ATPase component
LPPLLEIRSLSKRYGALAAVDDFDLTVEPHCAIGIAGPNGAGKTTLFDLISGHARPDQGSVVFRGRRIEHLPAHKICRMGMARTYQLESSFPSQTVAAHLLIAAYYGNGSLGHNVFRVRFPRECHDTALAVAQMVGLDTRLQTEAASLTILERKRLMLAAALAARPVLLMLDELAAGLTDDEIDEVIDLVQRLKEAGLTVIVIEHITSVLRRVSDRVVVMDQGRRLFEGSPQEFETDAEVRRLYLGEEHVPVGASQAGVDDVAGH